VVDDHELRRRLELLRERLDAGNVVIAPHLVEGFRKSLSAVRNGDDGLVDLSTVDGRIRSMAMMMAVMQDRDDMKSAASLADIQHSYFQRISAVFDNAYDLMLKHRGSPYSVSRAFLKDEEFVERNYQLVEPFLVDIEEFWESITEPTRYHLQDTSSLKGVFGGEIFPSDHRNIASSTGLYLDTIVLPDPFMKMRHIIKNSSKTEAVRLFLDIGLQLMAYRKLATADSSLPIVVILPSEFDLDEDHRESVVSAARPKAIRHAECLFGRTFADIEELQNFLQRLASPDEVTSALADSSRLLFDTEWEGDSSSQILQAVQRYGDQMGSHAGGLVLQQCISRMLQATDVSWKSSSLGGVPLIDAPTSWHYYNWSLEYGAQRDANTNLPLHLTRGMQRLAQTDMQWLGNIPPEALIAIRKEGALEEIRGMISKGVDEVVALNPDNFFRSADKIYDNLEAEFADHQKKISDLKAKKWKLAGSDIGSWVVAGTIEVAAAFSGAPALGVAGFVVSQLTDAPKIKDIPKIAKDLKKEGKALSKSAAGLLFQHRS
jgi:hypothetical protein